MKEIPVSPELAGLDLPRLPLPWEHDTRQEQNSRFPNGAIWKLSKIATTDIRQPLNEYFDRLEEQYLLLLPGHVASIVRDTMGQMSESTDSFYTSQTDNDFLVPVTDTATSQEVVWVSDVKELSAIGKVVLKKVLYAYENGLKTNT